MTTRDDELIASFLADGPHHGRVTTLDATLAGVRTTRQRPAWLVRVTAGTFDDERGTLLRMAPMLAAVAMLGLIAGALVVANQPPNPEPGPIVIPSASPDASQPQPSVSASADAELRGLVAYSVMEQLEPGEGDCDLDRPDHWCRVVRIWIANADGSGARAWHPNDVVGERLIGWAPDGSGLLYQSATDGDLVLETPDGSELGRWADDDLCPSPCSGAGEVTFSPDGTRLAFVRRSPEESNASVIAILDVGTGEVTELASTYTAIVGVTDLGQCVDVSSCQGINDVPRWSPDGTRLAFARQTISPEPGAAWLSAIVYVVNADGSDLHRVSPEGFYAVDPHWSPDGSRLVFMNDQQVVDEAHTTVERNLFDIYTVRPDGGGLRRLTSDGISVGPEWTTNGRLTFYRILSNGESESHENWIMDADGRNARVLGTGLAELTAAGCTTCLYPLPVAEGQGPTDAYWQPRP